MRLRALISVSDKSHLLDFAHWLIAHDYEIISTGGTASYLSLNQIKVTSVTTITKFPEIIDGRVKTLHPSIHGGILARKGIDEATLEEHGIGFIDLVVVNLYPFKDSISDPDCTYSRAIENIDIGGPAMIRASAKNHERVTVIVDPKDYAHATEQLTKTNANFKFRRVMAQKAFHHTSVYDAMIAGYLDQDEVGNSGLNQELSIQLQKTITCSYGENPHQQGNFYTQLTSNQPSIFKEGVLQGKTLSYNNISDSDAAIRCLNEFQAPTCVIIKHANPCGVASEAEINKAYESAFQCDPTSAFGGVIAFNRTIDERLANTIITNQFFEILIAPDFTADALTLLKKKPNARVIKLGAMSKLKHPSLEIKATYDGYLIQSSDQSKVKISDLKMVTQLIPTDTELEDLIFAWSVCKHVKSNAIVMASNARTTGIGAGQMSRIMSTKIAADQTKNQKNITTSLVLASDAFFPFADNIEMAAAQGVTAIIQPGGSIKDETIITVANKLGIKMVFTGIRNFKH
jgi:phosphoribosylaminoimidazolecarboxamide formyltransferase / IMP cyclohydrolase